MLGSFAALALLAALGSGVEGSELLFKAAPAWDAVEWIQGEPLTLEGLRGRVVLLRWWTGPECPYCSASAPYLNAWHSRYNQQGLAVVGFYHHKSRKPLTRQHVADLAARFGFRFPVAIDPDWRTLRRWWLDGHDRSFTSVSFLLDRRGIIRYIHPGGTYSPQEAADIESRMRELLIPRVAVNPPSMDRSSSPRSAVLARNGSNSGAQTERGRAEFEAQCASCHESDGRGTEGGPPPLQGSPWLRGPETRLIKIVLHGMRGKVEVNGKTYNLEMPGFGKVLTDEDIAAVLSFIRRQWGGRAEPIPPAGVRRVRDATRNRADYWTADELLLDQ